jgi:molecular chaperone DnaK (HSP70)
MSRYLIGIDLGTTNTVVSFIDTVIEGARPEIFRIPQLIEFGELADREMLPSFIFIPDGKEVPEKGFALPWDSNKDYAVGEFAMMNSSKSPLKVVSSSKSWLCSTNIDRFSSILPWGRDHSNKQISPVAAAKIILEFIRDSWNYKMASEDNSARFQEQDVILTVPASFDAVARELTVKAAEEAGLKIVLIEEPQAAFYAWLNEKGDLWRKEVASGDLILVCDIGGGTTDFSLIKVADAGGNLELGRVAVGNHILLGGDNMDLTLAFSVAEKLKKSDGITLDSYQITGLTHACREAKEKLMTESNAESYKLTVLGRGSSLIGGTISTELTRDEINDILLNGFFPICGLDAETASAKRTGLRTFGLNYESEPAITKHLAAFLRNYCKEPDKLPNTVLFNGGVTKASVIREKIVSAILSWVNDGRQIKVLTGNNPDLAVAIGASCYAAVKGGSGIRIKAGSSHSYYLGIEKSMPAVPGYVPPVQGLCVLPMGTEEGTGMDIDYNGIGLLVGETTEFRFFSSTLRKSDTQGVMIGDAGSSQELVELPSLSATLPVIKEIAPGTLIPVKLKVYFTETGTLQVWCVNDSLNAEWKLDFELRVER